ncbi:MAG: 4-hydroxythreonine-4-phosphate dehydrogenase PdxA [Candidatus Omnitrophica bacterium]|nr:4-hydroxythreonine-4-phosphate dehydrogenase PdxA [Candidatus Omnitrophota bacterium]
MNLRDVHIGITMGDPSGIGPEICVQATRALGGKFKLVIIGDLGVWRKVASHKSHVTCEFVDLKNVDLKRFNFGQVNAEYGRASMEYLDKAMELLRKRQIDCIVTAPISKESINLAGFHYSGHTEYFAEKTRSKNVVMMLVNKELKFCLVTRHIPLKEVAVKLNRAKITNTITVCRKALTEFFALQDPRLVVCGINPHGSDNGLIGREENQIIRPALQALKKKFKHLDGPLGADVAIGKAKNNLYDCVIAMYHDQALIPLKLLGDETGINMTLGLGFVRTSPLHGTAFDIAGKNIASPASLIAAIKLAAQCTLNQKKA